MRLLNVNTKRLESFYGFNIPEYAILSHMWGKEKDEVLFKHVAGSDDDRREGEKRRGYAKLLAACEQAIKDEWEYVWIDTCCIDKESSAELSEAINSMYAWYQRSEVCYAYLEDVQSNKNARKDKNATFQIVPFEKSRWFSRGWTLQELIAPRRVVFYSSDWVDIGTKASLRDVISSVTDIRVEMITNYDPDKASVAERMSWAAKRWTTRGEDIAYCLMGLLGVNMPLLYGEGTRAFRRLQEEIMKVSDDHSIFAWKTDYYRYNDHSELLRETRGMLADSPSNFLGAGNVMQSKYEGPYSAYSMSNKGLQIELPIRPIKPKDLISIDLADSQNIFKAILDCTYRDADPTQWVVIYLKMIKKGYYVRVFPDWLDRIQMNPNEADRDGWAVTSLLVPQVRNSTTIAIGLRDLKFKALPTGSGYSHKSESLVKVLRPYEQFNIITFDREGKNFGVLVGQDEGIPWMDIITENDYEELNLTGLSERNIINKIEPLYEEGGLRYHIVQQHLSLLCINVSKDYSVDVSGKLIHNLCCNVTIDIRRIAIQVPRPIHTSRNFLDDLDPRKVHHSFKKESAEWLAIFSPEVKRVLDVSLIHSLRDEEYQDPPLASLLPKPVIVLFSHDQKYLATATNRTVQIYDTITGSATCVLSYKSIRDLYVHCMCFSPNGNLLAIGTYDGHILLWDIIKKYVHRDFTSHQCGIEVVKFFPDSRLIISVPKHGVVRIFDIVEGTSEDVFNLGHEELTSAAVSPNNYLFAGAYGAVIRVWDMQTNQLVGVWQQHTKNVNCITFTPDGRGLLSGSDDETLKYWHIGGIEQGKEDSSHTVLANSPRIPSLHVGDNVGGSGQCILDIRHKGPVSSVAMSHDGNCIISVSRGNIQFWDSKDGTVQFLLRSRIVNPARSLYISPASNIFATCIRHRVQIWKYDGINYP